MGRRSKDRARLLPGAVAAVVVVWAAPLAAQDGARTGVEAQIAPWLEAAVHWTIRGIEIAGILTILIGGLAAIAVFLRRTVRDGPSERVYRNFRSSLGRSILLGLEFLVAADIIATVAIDPTLESVAVLAGVVGVRTFLSFALEVEIDGKWPWRKGEG